MAADVFSRNGKQPLHNRKFHSFYPVSMRTIIPFRLQNIQAILHKVVDNRLCLGLSPYMHAYQVLVQEWPMHYKAQDTYPQ